MVELAGREMSPPLELNFLVLQGRRELIAVGGPCLRLQDRKEGAPNIAGIYNTWSNWNI